MKHAVQNNQLNHSSNINDMVYVNKISYQGHVIVSVCDAELYGKEIDTPNGKIKIKEPFYGGDLVDISTALRIISESNNVNILGKNIVEAALKKGLIREEAVIDLSGIPYALIISY